MTYWRSKFVDRTTKPVNRSEHLPYTAYYDEASIEFVAERDAIIIARHGYTFDS